MPRRWGRWLAVASVLLALLPAGGVQAQPRGLSITLQPQSGPPGTVVTIFGRAAPPFTPVRIQFAGFPSQLGCRGGRGAELLATVTSDASGQFTAQHRTARDTADQAGIMYLAGIGTQSSPESISNQVCFTFDPAPIYPQTGFRVEGDAFWDYFVARGAVETFGFPVSRTITFLGCDTQFFQRHVLQGCDGGPVRPMNLLDPGLMPVDQINFSTFPAHDPAVAAAAPAPGAPGYGQAVLSYLQAAVPNSFEGLPVGFFSAFVNSVPGDVGRPAVTALRNLEVWGFPTSRPAFDPRNRSFVYQRFQRGIMHYSHADRATRGILLADWFKSVITGENVPPDLAAQAQDSRFLRQYCPDNPRWLCRPDQLPATDLTRAFEPLSQ